MSKILVVDDEANVRNLCYELFTKDGHQVITVARGEQVFAMLPEKPDLVLMDIEIPGENGLSLLRRMPKAKENRVPVVIFSGCVTAELEKEAYEAGAIEVIRKGVGLDELYKKVNKILSAKHRVLEESSKPRSDKILVVDDEERIRKFLADFLIGKGFKVITAQNGEEAVLLVKKERPSMVLLDVTMPGMDGTLTLRKIREIDAEVGVVMATSIQDEQIAQEATQIGAYAYVLKPFDLKYLELVVLTRLTLAA